ncbi:MAG: AAA family ATPase [Methanomicrobiaceae archaeon]|nr:AAA family ATPase [Methanomicrobiaceae archaeon]
MALSRTGGRKADGMRIVIAGKGGVGKTTLTAVLSRLYANTGKQVLAVDADPQENLAFSLGYPAEKASDIIPLSQNSDYIEEKTGARPGAGWGGFLTLNPNVSDVVERFGIRIDDKISLLVMGSVYAAGTGCLCPENALLNGVMRCIRLMEDDVIILDTQAGVEHFGRAISEGFKKALIVSEPTFNSLQVALHSAKLSCELGIGEIHLVINKLRFEDEKKKVTDIIKDGSLFSSITYLPYDAAVLKTEPDIAPLLNTGCPYVREAERLFQTISEGF